MIRKLDAAAHLNTDQQQHKNSCYKIAGFQLWILG